MNNNYDRGEQKPTPTTADEILQSRYGVTEGDVEITFEDPRPEPIKLVLLKSGELLLTKYQEYVGSDRVVLSDPKVVISRSSAADDGAVTTTISYSNWMALSADTTFNVSADAIVTVTDPVQSLYDSYLEGEF